jgi:hypothetical protein
MRSLALALILVALACKKKEPEKMAVPVPMKPAGPAGSGPKTPRFELADVQRRLASFAVVDLRADVSTLSGRERKALVHLRRASDAIDRIFWKQVWRRSLEVRAEVARVGGPVRDLYEIHYGPWDRLDHFKPFFGDAARPRGAAFYPEDLDKDAFEAYVRANPADRAALESPYTVVERRGGKLVAVPYSEAYRADLAQAAQELRAAADLVDAPSLARFLRSRAAAFLSNDYFDSECDWMDVEESRLDVTIGPYEVYEDDLLGLKAAFEAVIGIRDAAATRALAMFREHLPALEQALPIPDQYRSRRAAGSPIVVINKIYAGGDGKKGVQALAFNLPNDEKVRARKGSKKVMLKNVSEAKFEKILRPIAARLLASAHQGDIDFETFFNQGLMHELAHGMGPGILKREGGEITVNQALKELYSGIEEAKADIVGLHSIHVLLDRGVLSRERARFVYPSYLASMLRSVRFGAEEAHGRANVLQLNFLEEQGGITYDAKSGRFGVDAAKMPDAVRKLAVELLTIEGEGDYGRAQALLEKYGKPKPSLLAALKKLADIPVDIAPRYPGL